MQKLACRSYIHFKQSIYLSTIYIREDQLIRIIEKQNAAEIIPYKTPGW